MSNALSLNINKDSLIKILSNIQSVIDNKKIIPILANVKLEAEHGYLTVSGTNMDILVSEVIEADVELPGTLTIAAKNLFDIARKMPSDAIINISGDSDIKGKVQIKSKGCKFILPCLPTADYPIINTDDLYCSFDMPAVDFLNIISKCRFAMSNNEVQYDLQGVNIKTLENNIVATATNGHKLARVSIPQNTDIPNIILPARTTEILSKILAKLDGIVNVSMSDTKISINYKDTKIISKLIDSTFPDSERVIPTEFTNKLEINRKLFISIIERISLASDLRYHAVTFNIDNNKLIVTAGSSENGEAEEEVEIESDIVNLKRNYNYQYLIEVLNNINSDTAILYFNEPKTPTVILTPDNTNELYIVMPVGDKG